MKKILTEPLLHFTAIALVLFGVYQYLNPNVETDNLIKVSEGRIAEIRNSFANRWNRQPLPTELQTAIDGYTLNEMYLREARALSLDQGDQVINRRLRQKMEYLIDDLAMSQSPTQPQLQQYYQQHADNYQMQARYSLRQVYLSNDRPADELKSLIESQQQRIDQGQPPLGEASLLPGKVEQHSETQLSRLFGPEFVSSLQKLPHQQWVGPLISSYGHHFVMIEHYQPSQLQRFEVVKQQVLDDWRYQQQRDFKAGFETQLRARYQVAINSTTVDG